MFTPGGSECHVTVNGGAVEKISRHLFTATRASQLAVMVETYAGQLNEEPLQVPELHSVGIVPESSGYRVRHVTASCEGTAVADLDGEEMYTALREAAGTIASMSTIDGDDTLLTPFDCHGRNLLTTRSGLVMVDLFRPLPRREDGSFPMEQISYSGSWLRRKYTPYAHGTQAGAIIGLFATANGRRPSDYLRSALDEQEWCYDALADVRNPVLKDRIRAAIKHRFLTYYVRDGLSRLASSTRYHAGVRPHADTID